MKRNIKFVERDKGEHRHDFIIWKREYGSIVEFIEFFYGVERKHNWEKHREVITINYHKYYHIRLQKTHSDKCPFYNKYRKTGLKVCGKIIGWDSVRDGSFAHSQSSVKRKSRNRKYEHHTFRQKLKRDTKKYERDDFKIKIVGGLSLSLELSQHERSEMVDSNLREIETIDTLKEKYPGLPMFNEEIPEFLVHKISSQSLLEAITDWDLLVTHNGINECLIRDIFQFNKVNPIINFNINNMTVKFKKLSETAVVPTKGTTLSAGYDITATSVKCHRVLELSNINEVVTKVDCVLEYGTGLSVAIPEGFEGELRARSSISNKYMLLCNGVGTIDADYRGEIKLRFRCFFYVKLKTENNQINKEQIEHCINSSLNGESLYLDWNELYAIGDKIGQLLLKPVYIINWEEGELDDTERGEGGFGSTNKN